MSRLTSIFHGLRTLVRRSTDDRDLSDEVEHYLAETVDSYRAMGLPEAEAQRAARAALGSRASVRQMVREGRWETGVEGMAVDLRRAARRLRSRPGSNRSAGEQVRR